MKNRPFSKNTFLFKLMESYTLAHSIFLLIASLVVAVSWYVLFQDWIGAVVWLVVGTAVFFVLRWLKNKTHIFVQERTIGVVFTKQGDYVGFIDSGHHHIDVRKHEIKATIPKHKYKGDGRLTGLRTNEGVTVHVNWAADFRIDTDKLLLEQSKDEAYGLLKLPPGKIKGLTEVSIRTLIESKTVRQLYEPPDESRLLTQLEEKITAEVREKLRNSIYIVDDYRVYLSRIEFPPHIERALEVACERRLYKERYPHYGMQTASFTESSTR